MKDLVIGDVHFGIKSNSVIWLEKQIEFFNTQVIDTIKSEQPDRVVFLGDVFDVRYSLNIQIGLDVKEMFINLLNKFKDINFYIICGNHDLYSPLIENSKYSTYKVLFGSEFTDKYKNLVIIDDDYLIENRTAFLPWWWTENESRWETFLHDNKHNVDIIYCHSDLEHWESGRITAKEDIKVYAGHIHYPWMNKLQGLFNLGACCAFTFNDVNSSRYIYIIEDGKIINQIENTTTPFFKRYYNEEIFTLTEDDVDNSFVQLCIGSSLINKAQYIERVKEIKSQFINANIKVNIVDDSVVDDIRIRQDFNTNIAEYIESNIPEDLQDKYNAIKERLNGNS